MLVLANRGLVDGQTTHDPIRRLPSIEPTSSAPVPELTRSPSSEDVTDSQWEEEPEVIAEITDQPPIGPTWYKTVGWVHPEIWEGSFEIGINGSAGNAETFSMRTGGELIRETERTKTSLDITYSRTQASSVETQHNALVDGRIDWKLGESLWSVYTRFGIEYDEFKNFDLRLTSSGGLGFDIVKTEITELKLRLGAGVSREFGGVATEPVPEADFGFDFERKLTARQKLKAEVDYYPDWGDFSDFRLVSDVGWEILLDEDSNLHLKFGVIDRYDSTPNGAQRNDIDYSVLVMWKM